jgi:cell pole-organizing protein PopZ
MSEATPPGSAGDPSMEDILASIRRILNEEDATAGAAVPTGAGAAAPVVAQAHAQQQPNAGGSGGSDEDGVLVLDEAMLVPAAGSVSMPHEEPPPIPMPVPAVDTGSGLLAPESAAAAASSVGALLRTISEERTSQVHRGGPTIEDLVREELRPLLKVWLDQHLPPMVERLVRAEIERVTGRAVS